MAPSDALSPAEIGAALARDFIQAEWLRIYIGNGAAVSADEIDLWCPLPRIRFRAPPWWAIHDLIVSDDETLSAIYRGFVIQLADISRTSGDPALNNSIATASRHIDRMLASLAGRDR